MTRRTEETTEAYHARLSAESATKPSCAMSRSPLAAFVAFRAAFRDDDMSDEKWMLGELASHPPASADLGVLAQEIIRHGQMAATFVVGPGRSKWLDSAAALQRMHDQLAAIEERLK